MKNYDDQRHLFSSNKILNGVEPRIYIESVYALTIMDKN
jgi:hypothetical protein